MYLHDSRIAIAAAPLLEQAELSVLIAGAVVVLAGAVYLARRSRWRDMAGLPATAPHEIRAVDLLIAFYAFLFVTPMLAQLVALAGGPVPTTQPATPAGGDTAGAWAAVATKVIGQGINCLILLSIGRRRFSAGLAGWGLTRRSLGRRVALAGAIYLACWPVCTGLLKATTWLRAYLGAGPPEEHPAIRLLRDGSVPTGVVVLTIVSAAILAPILEELLFRGLLQPALAKRRRSAWQGVVLSGLVFGMIHIQVAQTVPALIFFGLVLGYIYAKTGSLTLVILVHAVFNAKTILWLMIDSAS